jgi:hypothetical protein
MVETTAVAEQATAALAALAEVPMEVLEDRPTEMELKVGVKVAVFPAVIIL